MKLFKILLPLLLLVYGCSSHTEYDVLIRNGQIIDGSGSPAFKGDIGIMADTIAVIGDLKNAKGRTEIHGARGMIR
jgi:N-acyl-D-amino-acid deacylase